MKRKRNSLKSSQQQQSLSSIITRSKTLHAAATKFNLPDECWESIFKFIINNCRNFKSLSLVSRQFLSITNRLPFSLTIRKQTRPFLPRLFHRFTNLTSLNFTSCYYYYGDLNKLLHEISCFPLKLISLNLSNKYTFPANGLRTFSQKITTLTSLICSKIVSLNNSDIFLIADCFPNLQMLDLSHCRNISEVGICHVLKKCCKIRHLDLTFCSKVKLLGLNFEVYNKLEVLNLSYTTVDDEALFVISKSCRGLVQLSVKGCYDVTKKGVKHVVENCRQLSEINLRHCSPMHPIVVASMIHSSPSLRKIIAPGRYDFSFKERELLSRQGRLVC